MVLSISRVIFFIGLISFFLPSALSAQENLNSTFNKKPLKHTSTHKMLTPIYKRPSKNRMYSNDCVHDYTADKMGFEYVILTGDCERALSHLSGAEVELHNFTAGLGLVFKKGPFWKIKVKRQYKFCKERMGDVVD